MPAGYADPYASTPTRSGTIVGTGRDYLNSDPDAAFYRYLQDSGSFDPSTAYGKYALAQQNRVFSRYKSEAADDPNQGFYDWLSNNQTNLPNDYQSQSPEARGDFSSRLLTPRARWVMG